MKNLALLILFTCGYSFAQQKESTHAFKFYKNSYKANSKNLKIVIVKDSDSIWCTIKNEKIIIPERRETGDMIIFYRKKSYIIKDVDFSKLRIDSDVTIGLDIKVKDLLLASSDKYPTFYTIKNELVLMEIDNFGNSKQLAFVAFSISALSSDTKIMHRSYSRVALLPN